MQRREPFTIKVGTVSFDEPYDAHYSYETAAWYTNYSLTPGTYDVYARYERDHYGYNGMKLSLFTNEIPGVITSENTQSLWGGVPIGSKQESREGKSISEKIQIKEHELTSGKIKLDLDVPFLKLAKHEKGHTVIELDENHPEWVSVLKDRERHNFKERLKPTGPAETTDYYSIAKKNGLFRDDVIDKGMQMGPFGFENVIRLDNQMRKDLGYGVVDSAVPLDEVAQRFSGKSGSVPVIINDVMKEIVEAHNLTPSKKSEYRSPAP